MERPEVGQELCCVSTGNAARYGGPELTKVVVYKIGRKYFYCKDPDNGLCDYRYHIDTWEEENGGYSRNSILYKRPKDWEDEGKANEIFSKMRRVFTAFGPRKISLPALIEIEKILDNYKED